MIQTAEKPNLNEKTTEKAKEGAEYILGNISDAFNEKSQQAKEKAEEISDSISEYVKQCPYKAILIASAVGAVLGILMKR